MKVEETPVDILLKMIQEQSISYKDCARWYEKRHYILTMATTFLTASITVIAGIKSISISREISNDIIIFLGGVTTVLASWGGIFLTKRALVYYYERT